MLRRSSAISKTAAWSSSIRRPVKTRPVAVSGKLYVNGTSMSNVVPEEGRLSNLVFDVGHIHAVLCRLSIRIPMSLAFPVSIPLGDSVLRLVQRAISALLLPLFCSVLASWNQSGAFMHCRYCRLAVLRREIVVQRKMSLTHFQQEVGNVCWESSFFTKRDAHLRCDDNF